MRAEAGTDPAPPPEAVLAALVEGHRMLALGRPAAALGAAEAALADDPDLVDALILRGAASKALRRFATAVEAYRHALALDPARVRVWVNLGNAHAELGELAAAEDCLREALARWPTFRAAHASLVAVCAMSGRDEATEAACRAALAIDPALVAANQHLASVLARRGEAEAAQRHRGAAYTKQNLFVEPGAGPAVLLPLTPEEGNIPLRYLFPRGEATLLKWLIDYATPDQPAALPAFDVVFNAVGEPDLEAPTNAAIERFRENCDRPFLNLPERVLRTRRDRLPALLAGLPDVVAPAVWRLPAGEPVPPVLPALVRPVGAHGGDGLRLAGTPEEFAEAMPGTGEAYVTAYHDARGPDGAWRKYRAMFVGGCVFPYHLALADHWLVHYRSAGMEAHPGRRAEEERFLDDPPAAIGARAWAALGAIGERLGLDYAGVDFSLLPDSRVLVFEANATMVVHPEAPDGPFAYKNPAVRTILRAFTEMIARAASDPDGRRRLPG